MGIKRPKRNGENVMDYIARSFLSFASGVFIGSTLMVHWRGGDWQILGFITLALLVMSGNINKIEKV
jgi:hypothetical protein